MRRTLELVALAGIAAAMAWPLQVTGDNQNAHYALVKALAEGVPYIDDTLGQTGDLQSHDVARSDDGHLYTVKAPGLAMAAQPAYSLARAVGMRTTGDPMRVLWVLNLLTSVLATVLLLLCVRDLADRFEPGFGTITAVVAGLGALTLPFATLFFSHALGTALIFAAFWVLTRERERPRLGTLVTAGGLAGLAVAVEHPTIWIVPVLAAYAASTQPIVPRAGAFAGGALLGVLPFLAFNVWAFGDPLHTPYADYWEAENNFDSLALPSWANLSKILFSSLGLLVLAPVMVAGAVGVVALYRTGRRAPALVCAAVPLAVTAYFSGPGAFGGLGPPRYLTPMVPFLLAPLALVFRRFPLTAGALAAITVFQAVVQTATGPLAAYDGEWLMRATERLFVSTAASLAGISGWYAIVPFFLAAVLALALAALSAPWPAPRYADAATAVVAAAAWAVVASASYNDWGKPPSTVYALAVAIGVALLAGLAAVSSHAFGRPPTQAVAR